MSDRSVVKLTQITTCKPKVTTMRNGWASTGVIAFIGCIAFSACNNSEHQGKRLADSNANYYSTNLMASGPNGEVYIIDQNGTRLTFATRSGVIYKQVNLNAPDSFETYKSFERKIHNTTDSLFVDAEWIGEKVYWTIFTNGINTRSASSIKLNSQYGTPLIPLCEKCNWVPVFDEESGKTTRYSIEGITPNVPIDVWNATVGISFRATSL